MFNNNDFGSHSRANSDFSSQLLKIYIKNLSEHKVEEKLQEISDRHYVFDTVFEICDNIEILVQNLFNSIENTSIEDYDINKPQNNDELVISNQFDTKLIKKSYDQLVYYDETLDKIFTSIQYNNFISSSDILIQLNNSIKDVINASSLLKRFYFDKDEMSRIGFYSIRYISYKQKDSTLNLVQNLQKIAFNSVKLLETILHKLKIFQSNINS
jgi:hypothetical protein